MALRTHFDKRRAAAAAGLVLALTALTILGTGALAWRPHDADAPTAAGPWTLLGQVGGRASSVALDGQRLALTVGRQVWVQDVSDPARATNHGASPLLPAIVRDISLVDGLAFVADGPGGLWIVDVADTSRPELLASLTLAGFATSVAARGSQAWVTAGGMLFGVDVSDPGAPSILGSVPIKPNTRKVVLAGSHAYVLADGSFLTVDIADPRHPSVEGMIESFPGVWYAHDLAVTADGNHVVLADTEVGLLVLDVSNPRRPRQVGASGGSGTAVAIAGTTAYLASGNPSTPSPAPWGLATFDLRDPARPQQLGFAPLPAGQFVGLVGQPARAFVVDETSGLRIVDVADATRPAAWPTWVSTTDVRDAALEGSRA